MTARVAAGVLLYRFSGERLEVLLAHMGGPLQSKRDLGAWTIPKGEPEVGEVDSEADLLAVGRREFAEETGHPLGDAPAASLGSIVQKGGKTVHGWAIAGDLDPALAHSNTFSMSWPPGSGQIQEFPEIDRVAWFDLPEARLRIKAAQEPFLDRLQELAQSGTASGPALVPLPRPQSAPGGVGDPAERVEPPAAPSVDGSPSDRPD